MLKAFARLFRPNPHTQAAHTLYAALVTQARLPFFYTEGGMPDSLNGRFDVILLHLSLMLSRLNEDSSAHAFAQRLMEVFITDMDNSLREMGVGDTGIKHRVTKMTRALYGRLHAYSDAHDHDQLEDALKRNLYHGELPDSGALMAVAAYAERLRGCLQAQPIPDLIQGKVQFP